MVQSYRCSVGIGQESLGGLVPPGRFVRFLTLGIVAQPRSCDVSGRALEDVMDALGHIVIMVQTVFIPLPLPLPASYVRVLSCSAVGSCREKGAIPAVTDDIGCVLGRTRFPQPSRQPGVGWFGYRRRW
jgi:hypothetical protein